MAISQVPHIFNAIPDRTVTRRRLKFVSQILYQLRILWSVKFIGWAFSLLPPKSPEKIALAHCIIWYQKQVLPGCGPGIEPDDSRPVSAER